MGYGFERRGILMVSTFTTVCCVITLGYAKEGDPLRPKKRKDLSELVTRL